MHFSSSVPSGLDQHPMSYSIIEDGRHPLQGLRWATEHTRSLGQALADIPVELSLDPAVGFRVVVEGQRRVLRASVREEIYRIGREAIVNAYRHSSAHDIHTDIEYWRTELRVSVRDNGCGIDPERLRWEGRGHWGLQGMRQRAEQIGATLHILSGVACGTEIELRVPGRIAFEQS